MDAVLLMLVCFGGYFIAYHTYGKFLAKRIFKLKDDSPAPSVQFCDGVDYVPTKKPIIFGHHYTSIAGTGPIVGPAIGIIWGWLPAVIWVLFGCILMGAVHDFGALVISMRNEGKSISEVTAKYINPRVRFIFFGIVFLSLLIVISIFGVVIAAVFSQFPSSVLAVWLQIPIAIGLGYAVYKKNARVIGSTAIAVAAMYFCIYYGSGHSISMPSLGSIPPTGVWVIILLIYAWVASTLPVTVLLQPRDYINAWQLFIAMGLLCAGAVVSGASGKMSMVAPAVNHNLPEGTLSIWPFMFVVIACGAISGFHSLVASGTSSKQVARESDSLFIGYGSMLMEGVLAVLVLICVGAGIGMSLTTADGSILSGSEAWGYQYSSWIGAKGLSDKLAPVINGAANMFGSIGLSKEIGITLMGVFIASFASTTLDTSVRLQRYVVSELANDLRINALKNRWAATTFAVVTAAALAFATGAEGVGAMKLWPLFGTANQLLASLALLVITIYLKRKGGLKFIVTAVPCVVMLVITNWAMIENEIKYISSGNWLLTTIGGVIFALAMWMTVEVAITFVKMKKTTAVAVDLREAI